ncbi:MAG TPA: hypothetical protein VKB79_22370 [Bryobacteraceae bacterium]|nr:hypothetical protein [Bryobacteraceae bacterium]
MGDEEMAATKNIIAGVGSMANLRMKRWLPAVVAALTMGSAQGATLRNHAFAFNPPPAGSGCGAPLPVDYFESTDQSIVFWVLLNMKAGEAATVSWSTQAGVLDSSTSFQAVSSDGEYCYWVSEPLSGSPASAVGGIWTYTAQVGQTSLISASTLVVTPGAPQISRGGVVNTASGTTNGGMIAAGSLVSIYGANLAPGPAQATGAPLPLSLNGVTVTFNGIAVGIVQVSSSEVDVQAPWGIPSDTAFVQVNNNGTATNLERVRVGASAPGLFFDSSNSASAATVYRYPADGSSGDWVSANNPLQRGDTAIFLATGLGAIADPPANFAPGNGDSAAVLPLSVAFGGARSSDAFAVLATGTSAGEIGVMYITAIVPNEAPNGSAIPVTVQVAGSVANQVTVPIVGVARPIAVPSLTAVGGYPPVDATSGYNPTSAISLSASGIYTNVRTYVKFSDQTGYSATLPALAVYPDRVISLIPPYVDQSTHKTTAGTVSCAIVQYVAGQALVSNAQTITITPLYAAPGSLGEMTSKYLATIARDARQMAGAYIYRQEISGGKRFTAPSANLLADTIVTGLQPLIGGAEEVAAGNASSIDLGTINGQDVTIDSNTIALADALIAASLNETAKAFANPPIITDQNGKPLERGALAKEKPHSIIGSLTTYFGLVAQCNMPWNQLNGPNPNCPSPTQAFNTVLTAAGASLVEAVDSVKEDAKRFAEGPGLMIGLLVGGEAPAIIGKLATTAAVGQGLFHAARYLTDNDEEKTADYQAAAKTFAELAGDGLIDATKDFSGDLIGLGDEEATEDFDQFAESGIGKVVEQFIKNTFDAPEKLAGNEDVTDSNGNNSLDTDIDSSPAIEITGAADNGSGTGLQNVTVSLTDGNDADEPIATGATSTDGSFDLMVPASAVGGSVPNNAIFEITSMDENGDLASFDGNSINLAAGSQSIGTWSITYDNDNDGDDDSDGSDAVRPGKGHARAVPHSSRLSARQRKQLASEIDQWGRALAGERHRPVARRFAPPANRNAVR